MNIQKLKGALFAIALVGSFMILISIVLIDVVWVLSLVCS